MFNTIEVLNFDDSIEIYHGAKGAQSRVNIAIENLNTREKTTSILRHPHKKVVFSKPSQNDRYMLTASPGGLKGFFIWKKERKVIPSQKALRVLIVGTGRCGTTSITNLINDMSFNDGEKVIARHETLVPEILPLIAEKKFNEIRRTSRGFLHNVEAAAHLTMAIEFVDALKKILIIRDGRKVVQSGINRGWYQNDGMWNRIKPEFSGSVFEKCCKFWTFMNERALKNNSMTFRLEDLSRSEETLGSLLDAMGIQPGRRRLPMSNKGAKKSDFDQWTLKEKSIFESNCGSLMDDFYPGWLKDY